VRITSPTLAIVELIRKGRGAHFDPECVDAFMSVFDEVLRIKHVTAMLRRGLRRLLTKNVDASFKKAFLAPKTPSGPTQDRRLRAVILAGCRLWASPSSINPHTL